VIETLEKLWSSRGAEIIDQLAAEKPEVVASLIARLIPQELATQAITGDDEQKAQSDQQVTIKVVTQQHQDVLPPREVEGELLPDTTH
jgi:DNA-directed RNA polymerase